MSENMYNGQTWETHTVSLLLNNTYSLYDAARELAQEDASGASLGEWVTAWFWGDLVAFEATDRGAVEGTRNDMSRNAFDRIDWKAVAEDLAAD